MEQIENYTGLSEQLFKLYNNPIAVFLEIVNLRESVYLNK